MLQEIQRRACPSSSYEELQYYCVEKKLALSVKFLIRRYFSNVPRRNCEIGRRGWAFYESATLNASVLTSTGEKMTMHIF